MTFNRLNKAWGAIVSGAILATGGMTMGGPDDAFRMSATRITEIVGYAVQDRTGLRVGEIARVETDDQGRTRWLFIELDAGGKARVASFRADLDAQQKLVSLRLSEDLLIARADANAGEMVSSPST
jgi:hypothetical protein